MSIASRVIEEITAQNMIVVEGYYAPLPAKLKTRLVWRGNAVEQLEAVIAEELLKGARRYLRRREPDPASANPIDRLTPRERECLKLMNDKRQYDRRQIAALMTVTPGTVHQMQKRIRRKLGGKVT